MTDATGVRAVLTMDVPAESGAAFEKEWQSVASWVQRQEGCLRQTLCRITERPLTTYVITSDWTGREAYLRFETSQRQDDATAGLRALRTGVRMEVLDIIEHKEKK